MSEPTVFVCAGGGGVGKTTTSAALALALARAGHRTLVVTIDPARRLADAMGIPIDSEAHAVHLPGVEGRLFAVMPDPRQATRRFVEDLFVHQPDALARLLANPQYTMIEDALAGVHEIVAMNSVTRAVPRFDIDIVIVDTAPSRHAIDFVTYPQRLADMLGGRVVGFLARLASSLNPSSPDDEKKGLIARGRRKLEQAMGKVLGLAFIRDLSGLFTELSRVRERFVAFSELTARMLLGPQSRYILVGAPTGSSSDDLAYLFRKLKKIGIRPRSLVLNRADRRTPVWIDILRQLPDLDTSLASALTTLHDEVERRVIVSDAVAATYIQTHPDVHLIRLPTIDSREPAEIVETLASALAEHLGDLQKS